MSRRPEFPCPLSAIVTAPTLATAPGPVYRATLAIAAAYWLAGCSLPMTDDVTLANICRLPLPRLREAKSLVMQALAEITPLLDKAYRRALQVYEGRAGRMSRARDTMAVHRVLDGVERREISMGPPISAPQRALSIPPGHVIAVPAAQTSGTTSQDGFTD